MSWLDKLLPDRPNISSSTCLTRQELQDKIVSHFVTRMEQESTTDGVLFPTNFIIYLSKVDYEMRKQSFAVSVQELVNKSLKRKIDRAIQDIPDFIPYSSFWQFQFLVFPEDGFIEEQGQKKYGLEPKEVLIQSTLCPPGDGGPSVVNDATDHMVTTIHTKDSLSMSNLAINYEAVKNVDILASDKFRVPYGRHLASVPQNENGAMKPSANDAKCILKIISGAKFSTGSSTFYMTSDNLIIEGPGKDSMRGGIPVAHIEDKGVGERQVTIKRDGEHYRLFAHGDVIVEETFVEPDGKSSVVLEAGNQILINGEIAIEFKIK